MLKYGLTANFTGLRIKIRLKAKLLIPAVSSSGESQSVVKKPVDRTTLLKKPLEIVGHSRSLFLNSKYDLSLER